MIRVKDIIEYVESLTRHTLNVDEGVQYGSLERPIKKVLVCWMATSSALEETGKTGSDLVIAHESLYYPYDAIVRKDNPLGWEKWQTNVQRTSLLMKYNLTFLRIHGSLDEICIFDDFAKELGLGEAVKADDLSKIYQIPTCTLKNLVEKVKKRIGIDEVRVSAPNGMEQKVGRVGLPWGGLGLFVNVKYQQQLIEKGCDVFIAGESDEYGFLFSSECGIPMIETSHVISENPGLKHFTNMLKDEFPQITVKFYANQCPWQSC